MPLLFVWEITFFWFDWFLLVATTLTSYFVRFGWSFPAFLGLFCHHHSDLIFLPKESLMFPRGTRTFFFFILNMRVIIGFSSGLGWMMWHFFLAPLNVLIVCTILFIFLLLTNCLIDRGKLGKRTRVVDTTISQGAEFLCLPSYLNWHSVVVCPKTPRTTYWHNGFCEFFFFESERSLK